MIGKPDKFFVINHFLDEKFCWAVDVSDDNDVDVHLKKKLFQTGSALEKGCSTNQKSEEIHAFKL